MVLESEWEEVLDSGSGTSLAWVWRLEQDKESEASRDRQDNVPARDRQDNILVLGPGHIL